MDADETSDPTASERFTVAFAQRLHADVALLCELFDRGIEVDGEAVLADGPKWVIYGRTTYDGEMILAEYDDPDEADAVIRSLPIHVTQRRS